MSIKSVLQLILLSLIIIIIGGVYFIYFYSNEDLNRISIIKKSETIYDEDTKLQMDQVILGGKEMQNLDNIAKTNANNIDTNTKVKLNDKNKNNLIFNSEDNINQNKNLTKQIEYIASNKRGDTFKILAKDGQTNLENSNILELNTVNGTISSTEKNEIYIISDNAKYNYENYNSSFFNNVKINFDDKIILCDNLDFSFNDNIAVGYGNVTVKNENSIMNADSISLNMKTKDIVINSKNKVNIKVE
tara:strand:+ start:7787 stop:8524 length:738 start_codon:yes stop_codon:yes gene_type:complete